MFSSLFRLNIEKLPNDLQRETLQINDDFAGRTAGVDARRAENAAEVAEAGDGGRSAPQPDRFRENGDHGGPGQR